MGLNLVAQIVILYTPIGQFLSDSLQYFRFEVNSNVLFPVMLNIHKNMAWCFCIMDITLIIWLDEIKDALCISASSWVTRQQCTCNTVRLPYCTLHWFGEVTQILRTSFSPQLANHWMYPFTRYCRKDCRIIFTRLALYRITVQTCNTYNIALLMKMPGLQIVEVINKIFQLIEPTIHQITRRF